MIVGFEIQFCLKCLVLIFTSQAIWLYEENEYRTVYCYQSGILALHTCAGIKDRISR